MTEHEVQFGTLQANGQVTDVRTIKQSDIMRCPHFILAPEHFRDDGSCKCNEPDDPDMAAWGYTWDAGKGRWV